MPTVTFKNRWAKYDYKKFPGKEMDPVSMTVPDQTLPLREILQRFADNRVVPEQLQAIWEEEGKSIIDTSMMNKIEKAELANQVRGQIANMSKKLKEIQRLKNVDGTKVPKPEGQKTDEQLKAEQQVTPEV